MDGGSLESIRPYELPDMMVKARPSPDAIDGWQVSVVAKKVHAANRIVTEFMLAANEAMAMHGDTHGVLMPFRCQEMDEVLEAGIEATPGSVSKLAGHTVYFSIGNSIKSSVLALAWRTVHGVVVAWRTMQWHGFSLAWCTVHWHGCAVS